jgi:hypothetical protein
VFIKEKPIHSFFCFPKLRKEIRAIEIYQQRLWSRWNVFEESNSRGVIVDHIEIHKGEIHRVEIIYIKSFSYLIQTILQCIPHIKGFHSYLMYWKH